MQTLKGCEAEIQSCNILRVAAGTTGLMGGDSGHGGRTVFELEDVCSTDISVTPIGESELGNGGVRIELGGDSELLTFVAALEWAAGKLRQKLNEEGVSFLDERPREL